MPIINLLDLSPTPENERLKHSIDVEIRSTLKSLFDSYDIFEYDIHSDRTKCTYDGYTVDTTPCTVRTTHYARVVINDIKYDLIKIFHHPRFSSLPRANLLNSTLSLRLTGYESVTYNVYSPTPAANAWKVIQRHIEQLSSLHECHEELLMSGYGDWIVGD